MGRRAGLKAGLKAALAVLTLAFLYYTSFNFRLKTGPIIPLTIDRDEFVQQWLDTQLLGPFQPSAVRGYCDQAEWRPNLIFHLADATGGIGNVRARFLDFFYYAMEAGASIVIPSTNIRSSADLYDVAGGEERAPFNRMWDEAWFRASVKDACPQMVIYESNDTSSLGKKIENSWDPASPSRRKDVGRKSWTDLASIWLKEQGYEENSSTTYVVDLAQTMWLVDATRTMPSMRTNFGKLLRVNPEMRRYAAIAMSNLASVYGIHLDPSDRLHRDAFYGAHLRTESDAITAGYTSGGCDESSCPLRFEEQTDGYIEAAHGAGLRVIFTASGNQTDIENFRIKAAKQSPPLIVVDKWDLLSPEEITKLSEHHWDVQATVDWEIMMRCSVFGSIAQSSFGWNIAMARTVWMDEMGIVNDPYYIPAKEPLAFCYNNRLNRIMGRNYILEGEAPVMFP